MEYRYYEIPAGSPVLALLGDKGCRITEERLIICIFIIIWKLVFAIMGKAQLLLKKKTYPLTEICLRWYRRTFPIPTTSTGDSVSYWEWLFIDADKFLREVYKDNPQDGTESDRSRE